MSLILSQTEWRRTGIALTSCWLIALVFAFFVSQAIATLTPLQTVKTGTEQVLHILRAQAVNKQQRRAEIRTVVYQYFDFDMIAKRALGHYWNEQPPAKQQEYVRAFSEFLFNLYINRVENYTDQKITYETKGEQGRYAVVDAVIASSKTEKIPLSYHLHLKDGKWRAYDVVIGGVSLVNNYRSQFRSILARSSFDDLLNRLQEKNLHNQ